MKAEMPQIVSQALVFLSNSCFVNKFRKPQHSFQALQILKFGIVP